MPKYVIVTRGSGKTFSLLKECAEYIDKYPNGEIVFISPTKYRSNFTKQYAKDMVERQLISKKVLHKTWFLTWDEYVRLRYLCHLPKSRRVVCLDDVDDLFRQLCDSPVLAVSYGPVEEIRLEERSDDNNDKN